MSDDTALSALPAPRTASDPVERWLPVVGYEGLYEVSDRGRVKSLARITCQGKRLRERILKTTSSRKKPAIPYPSVGLHMDGAARTVTVHALVTEAFIGSRPEGLVVRHLDGDHTNSTLANLTYGTPAENTADTLRHGHNVAASKTHCKRGHEFTPRNTYRHANGHRKCRRCAADWEAAKRHARQLDLARMREV